MIVIRYTQDGTIPEGATNGDGVCDIVRRRKNGGST
jgi:hypothetical protein